MDIAVHGRHFAVPADLRHSAEEKVANLSKYLDGMERAEVCFFEERNPRIAEPVGCEVTAAGHGHVVRARATGQQPAEALDRVVDKAAHQLTRLKEKLVGRSHPHHAHRAERPGAVVGTALLDGLDLDETDVHRNGRRIVRTKRFAIKPMTPDEAVLQMDLLSHDFFFFANAETSRPAVVYRRRDGNFGLIDTD